jgi:squalene synthase HpnC
MARDATLRSESAVFPAVASDAITSTDPPAADQAYLRSKESRENFPVALVLLPARYRRHLRRLYDVARIIDDLGDEASGDRTAALLAFREDLAAVWRGGPPTDSPYATVLRNLTESVTACDLPQQPFLDLIDANLRDQKTSAYQTYDDLLGYCALSANPVGRLVLAVFGARVTSRTEELSDQICTALQVIEHCQDAAEDHRAGRCYLPLKDLDQYGVQRRDFGRDAATPAVRQLIRFEAERAEAQLRLGAALLTELHGWSRLAVAGYAAGGHAAVMALRRAGWSVLPGPPPRRRRDVLACLAVLWLRAHRRRSPGVRSGEGA